MAAASGDVEELRKVLDSAKHLCNDFSTINGRTPLSWADQAAVLPEISWLWPDWLPKGMVSLIVGPPEVGKSALALWIAKCVLTGDPLPDGSLIETPGRVVWMESESAEVLNIDRARKWGLPLERILKPTLGHDPLSEVTLLDPDGWLAFETAVYTTDVRLVIVDSLGGVYMRENDPQIKLIMKRLARLARDTRVPIMVVHHPRKLNLGEHDIITLDRVRGHSGIIQFVRMIWAVERPDPIIELRVRVKVIKSNLAMKPEPFGFEICPDEGLIYVDVPEDPRTESQKEKAADLILTLLNDGPKHSTEIYGEAEGAGISKNTIRRAKNTLGVVTRRDGERNCWMWGFSSHFS
jgi:hypothetical protein